MVGDVASLLLVCLLIRPFYLFLIFVFVFDWLLRCLLINPAYQKIQDVCCHITMNIVMNIIII